MSISTIERWRRDAAANDLDFKRKTSGVRPPEIDRAIASLASLNNEPFLSKLEAFFVFVVWLRWPKNQGCHHMAISACLASYFSQKAKGVSLDQLGIEERSHVLRHLNLIDIRDAFSMESFNVVYFELICFENSDYHDYDLAAIIVRLLLDGFSKSTPLSLTKVFEIIADRSFVDVRFYSLRNLFNFWPNVSASAPFCYVNHYYSNLSIFLDPQDPEFANDVEKLLSDTSAFRDLFSRSLWVVNTLSENLDPRAARAISFPAFPADLEPKETLPPPQEAATKRTK